MALPAPVEHLANGLHAAMHGLVYNWLLEPAFDLEATGLTTLEVFLRGIGLSPTISAANKG